MNVIHLHPRARRIRKAVRETLLRGGQMRIGRLIVGQCRIPHPGN